MDSVTSNTLVASGLKKRKSSPPKDKPCKSCGTLFFGTAQQDRCRPCQIEATKKNKREYQARRKAAQKAAKPVTVPTPPKEKSYRVAKLRRKPSMGLVLEPSLLAGTTKPFPVFAEGCQWPIYDPNQKRPSDYREWFCDARKEPGQVYCRKHCNIAYNIRIKEAA